MKTINNLHKYISYRITLWIVTILGLLILIEGINKISFQIANNIYEYVRKFDPVQSFLYITIHHVFQAIFAFSLVQVFTLITKKSLSDAGFRRAGFKEGIKFVGVFLLLWLLIQGTIGTILIKASITKPSFPYPLTAKNYLGNLGFQVFLSGTSEELLYRALPIPIILLLGEYTGVKTRKSKILAIIVSVLIFLVGHIGYQLFPFKIVYYDLLQVITVIIFGITYGIIYIKYKNIYLAMLLHSLLNGLITLMTLGFWILNK